MAITIQELIASDTVSQAVDKINFNFDQLLLNGGGPLGPAGPAGPAGPIGGRGERGSEWYEDDSVTAPGKNPNNFPPTLLPLKADYYLQFNGDVWEYNGTLWEQTTISLLGPQGPTGASVGLSQFGNSPNPGNPGGAAPNNYSQTAKNVGYPSLMAQGSQTISTDNQGVPTFAVGIAGPDDISQYPNGVNVTTDFRIIDQFAGTLDSSNTSFLLHQKNSGTAALRFMGGTEAGEDFEQLDYTKLSQIRLSSDDTLNIVVPKHPTTVGSTSDTIGFNVETEERGQSYRSGAGLEFTTGTKGGSGSPFFNSNFIATVNTFNPLGSSPKGKFDFNTVGIGANTRLQMGGDDIVIPPTTLADGYLLAEARIIELLGSSGIGLSSQDNVTAKAQGGQIVVSGGITLETQLANDINITAAGSGDIVLNSAAGGVTNISSSVSTTINTGVNYIDVDLATGIVAKTQNNSNSINLIASGVQNDINLSATQNIVLGAVADSAIFPNIKMWLSGVTNRLTAYRGKETWGASEMPVPNLLVDAPVYKHEWTNLAAADNPILGGSVVRQMGAQGYYTNAGVQYQQYNDGEDTVIIGKPEYNPGVLGGNRLGIFVNTSNATVPPQFSNNGVTKENPVMESFRVDGTTTKISNNLILGGENGAQQLDIDPLWDITPVDGNTYNVTATSPMMQVNIGTFTPTQNAIAINSMPNGSSKGGWEADLILQFNDEDMILGQQFKLEVTIQPSKFVFSGASVAEQWGKLNIYYQNMTKGGGAPTAKLAGIAQTTQADIINFGAGGVTSYKTYTQLYEFQFSNMGNKTFYNGSTNNGAGGIILKKGWTLNSVSFLTYGEENNVTYSMAPISSS